MYNIIYKKKQRTWEQSSISVILSEYECVILLYYYKFVLQVHDRKQRNPLNLYI